MNPLLRRLRQDLFATPADGLITVALLAVFGAGAASFLRWAFSQARWAVIQANSTLFAVGRYPIDQQWRLWLLTALLAAATGITWGMLRSHPRPDRGGTLWPRNDRIAVGLLVALSLLLPKPEATDQPIQTALQRLHKACGKTLPVAEIVAAFNLGDALGSGWPDQLPVRCL